MSRLDEHLAHILSEVVPTRGAAQGGLSESYLQALAQRPQPPLLARGLEQWNAGHFYAQHETLEWLWRATEEPVRDAFKGIIQAGVGAYHVLRCNRRGALGKWTGAIGYLEPFAGSYPYGIDIGHLRQQILAQRAALLKDESPEWTVQQAALQSLEVHWQPQLAAPQVTALLRRLDRSWEEGPFALRTQWHPLEEDAARWSPGAQGSAYQLLQQAGRRRWEIAAGYFGAEQQAPPEAWRRFERWLNEAQEALREPVGFLDDDQLKDALVGEIEQLIDQDLYHAGELALLRRWYRTAHPS